MSLTPSRAQGSLTYLGTFDDAVERYPWDIPIDRDYLLQSIIRHTLFGDKLALNDGYLVMNQLGRDCLRAGTQSLLYNLIHEGFVRILTNGDDIAESIRKRAQAGVATHKALIAAPDWPEIEERLRLVSRRQRQTESFLAWPRQDMTTGFLLAMDRCRARTPAQLGLAHVPPGLVDRAIDRLAEELKHHHGAARTKWEKISAELIDQDSSIRTPHDALRDMMGLANEAYHMNFAACLSDRPDAVLGVETRQSPAFDELFGIEELSVQRLSQFKPIAVPNTPALRDADRLRHFIIEGSSAWRAKQDYLRAQDAFLSGATGADAEAMDDARAAYVGYLARHFGVRFEMRPTDFTISLYLFAGIASAEAITDPLTGLAIGGLVFAAEQFVKPLVMRRVALRDLENRLRDGDEAAHAPDLRRRLQHRSALASIGLDPAKAAQLRAGIPYFTA